MVEADGRCRDVTYAELREASNRMANVLAATGVGIGDVVTVLLPPGFELYAVVLGALAHRCVVSTLSVALGPELIGARLRLSSSSLLVTSDRRLDDALAAEVAAAGWHIPVLVTGTSAPRAGAVPLEPLLHAASPSYDIGPTDAEDPAFVNFTGGATGVPKCALHVHGAVAVHAATAAMVLAVGFRSANWRSASVDPKPRLADRAVMTAPLAVAGSILYVIHHIVVKANLFLVAGAIVLVGSIL